MHFQVLQNRLVSSSCHVLFRNSTSSSSFSNRVFQCWRSTRGYSVNAASTIAHRLQNDPSFLHQLSSQLSPNVRTSLVNLLQPASPSSSSSSSSRKVTKMQYLYLFVRTMIPFIGFGLTSNAALVLAGDYIDSTVCMMFGFSTLAAAGMGNAISDTVGMLSTEPIQRLSEKLGIPEPDVSGEEEDTATKVAGVAKILGMIIGCLLGLLPLIWIKEPTPHMVDLVSLCLSPEQKIGVANAMIRCQYRKGDKIIERGSEGNWLHIIIEGRVEVIGRDVEGNPVHICNFDEGSVVGELEMLYEQPCVADVVAISDTVETRKIHKSDVQQHMGTAFAVFMQRISTDPAYTQSPCPVVHNHGPSFEKAQEPQ